MLFRILDKTEALGSTKLINEQLNNMIARYLKTAEYDIAVKSALLNWITGTANSTVRHSVNNGFDAWRKLYNRYEPLAQDLQNIFICEFMSIKPVAENDIEFIQRNRTYYRLIRKGRTR